MRDDDARAQYRTVWRPALCAVIDSLVALRRAMDQWFQRER